MLDQAYGQLTRDQALLTNAKLDLERYKGLLAKDSIAKQQVDTQESLAHQDEGVVQLDRAQVDNAKLQLGFTRITAPISGRLGLRQLDVGNMIHAADTNGLVVITQTQPIAVIFSIPSDSLAPVLARIHAGESLSVDAFDRYGKVKLATGKLLTVDNQLDVTTGTVKLKAEFANTDNSLFPNQFVNARLRVETRHDSTLIPVAAVQRGTQGTFIYVIGQDQTVSIRFVTLGPGSGEWIAIEKGLLPGEQVVIAGADKLRDGAKVAINSREDTAGKGDKNHGYSGEHKRGTDAPPEAPTSATYGGSSRQGQQ
jgi:multidrug efflux system membrane fusion protein